MTPAALLRATAFRLRARVAARRAAWSVAATVSAVAATLAVAKAGLEMPALVSPLPVLWTGLAIATALAARAVFSGPGLAEAAFVLDAHTRSAERFATLVDLAAGPADHPFRAATARACASIAARLSPREAAPVRLSPAPLSALAVAALLVVAVVLAPRAGEAERRAMAEEAGRLRAVAGALEGAASADVADLKRSLDALARALDEGRLDAADLARAVAEARSALDRAKRREALPDALQALAAERPDLARLADAYAAGAEAQEAPLAAAEAADAADAVKAAAPNSTLDEARAALRRARADALRALAGAAAAESDPLRRLADTIEAGARRPAGQAAIDLAQDIRGAPDRVSALRQGLARLEATERLLQGLTGAPGGPSSAGMARRRLTAGDAQGGPNAALAGASNTSGGVAVGAPGGTAAAAERHPATGTAVAEHDAPGAARTHSITTTGRPERRADLPPRLAAVAARYFHEEETPR